MYGGRPSGDAWDGSPAGTPAPRTSYLGDARGYGLGLGGLTTQLSTRGQGQPCFPRALGDGDGTAPAWPVRAPRAEPVHYQASVNICLFFLHVWFLSFFFPNSKHSRFQVYSSEEEVGRGSWTQNNVALRGVPVSPLTVVRKPRVRTENPTQQAGAGWTGPEGGAHGVCGRPQTLCPVEGPHTVQSQLPPLASRASVMLVLPHGILRST